MRMDKTKTILFLIIFLLTVPHLSGTSSSNINEFPYKKNSWELHSCGMTVIHKNGSKLETKHSSEQFSFIRSTVIKENKKWAKVRVDWKKDPSSIGYYHNKTIPDYPDLTFRVSKNDNMAYLNRTGDLYGFFPFFVYNYNNTNILKGEKEKRISLDKEYIINYIVDSRFSYSTKHFTIKKTLEIRSSKSIEYIRKNEILNTPKKIERNMMRVTCKGEYPISYDFLIPARYLIKNTTDEKYIRIVGSLDSDQQKAVEFLHEVENGPKVESKFFYYIQILVIVFLIAIFAFSSYIYYRKNRGD